MFAIDLKIKKGKIIDISNMPQSVDLWYKYFIQKGCLKNRKYHRYLMSLIITLAAINLTAADQDSLNVTELKQMSYFITEGSPVQQIQTIERLLSYYDFIHLPGLIAEALRKANFFRPNDKERLTILFCKKMLGGFCYTKEHRILAFEHVLSLKDSPTLLAHLTTVFIRMQLDEGDLKTRTIARIGSLYVEQQMRQTAQKFQASFAS